MGVERHVQQKSRGERRYRPSCVPINTPPAQKGAAETGESDHAIERSRGGPTTACDGPGRLLALVLTGGNGPTNTTAALLQWL
jgi:hypothetical protein